MALKDILVQLDNAPASDRRLAVACDLARQHGAHLHGLCVIDIAYSSSLLYVDDVVAVQLIDQLRGQAQADAAMIEGRFRARMRAEGLAHEWSCVEGIAADVVTEHARFSDLCVLGQTDPDNTAVTANGAVLEHVLFGSGRPVLMVPYVGSFGPVGHNVALGWTPTREAARAMNDALPLLAPNAAVTVLAIARDAEALGEAGTLTAPIAAHLARHGVEATCREIVSFDLAAADVLLNTLADTGADLLVVGAYGHSRLREMVMGGVTRTLLEQATVPVLMSH